MNLQKRLKPFKTSYKASMRVSVERNLIRKFGF